MPSLVVLTPDQVAEMKQQHAAGGAAWSIARKMKLSHPTVLRLFREHGIVCARGPRGRPTNMLGREWLRTKVASVRPTKADIAWAAGFIEGEGCFSRGSVTASQVNREPLERLLALFGGSINENKTGRSKPIHTWNTSGARARGIAETLWTFLSARRKEQARRMLDFRRPKRGR
jgi:hypothetical protein